MPAHTPSPPAAATVRDDDLIAWLPPRLDGIVPGLELRARGTGTPGLSLAAEVDLAPGGPGLRLRLAAPTPVRAALAALDRDRSTLPAFAAAVRAWRDGALGRARDAAAPARDAISGLDGDALDAAFLDRLGATLDGEVVPRPGREAAALAPHVGRLMRLLDVHATVRRVRALAGYDAALERLAGGRPPRRVVLHLGPTNAGKTHAALEALARAPTGTYLAPLRLLALETYERLDPRVPGAALLTGEERLGAAAPTHLAQTVETLDLGRDCDVAVLDEVQLLASPERGWAWTRALLGARCRELHLCGSPDAEPLVRQALALVGEEPEVVRHDRLAPLRLGDPVGGHADLGPGDALVCFSRADVLLHREVLQRLGHAVAVVYGALSPEVRRAEAARFRSGEAGILVATDAIGMGLNLGPLRRVVLAATHKFDGTAQRPLLRAEIRQIVGRAGRYGHQAEGLAAGLGEAAHRAVAEALGEGCDVAAAGDGRLYLRPEPGQVAAVSDALGRPRLAPALRTFLEGLAHRGSPFRPPRLDEIMAVAAIVDGYRLTIEEGYTLACAPVRLRDPGAEAMLRAFALALSAGRPAPVPGGRGPATLRAAEEAVRALSTYLWLARRFPGSFPDVAEAMARRAAANAAIEAALRADASQRAGAREDAA